MIKLRDNIDPEILRNFGFQKGKEFFGKEKWCGNGIGYEYQSEWFMKFLRMDEETGELGENGDIYYSEGDIPMIQMVFRTDFKNRDLFIDATPAGTYHISDFDMVMETIVKLTEAGIIEIG